ncbi:MAG: FhaA domain-containing protein [bacterium]
MGLKDKMKKAWKRVSDLEDDSEMAQSQAKEDERISYKDISKKLKEIMKQNVDVVGRKIIIPNYYAIYFNEVDRNKRLEVEDVLCDELKEELYHEMRKINPEQNKREMLIEIKTDSSLTNGQFRVEHHIKKPEQAEEIEKVSEMDAAVEQPRVEDENDYKQTVVERIPPKFSNDEQKTIVQRPVNELLYKLSVDSGERKEEIVITKESISIGRGSQDDVVLQSPDFSISRSHATLELRAGEYFLIPLGINGTFLNGQELELKKEVRISPDDEIKIMDYTLKILS